MQVTRTQNCAAKTFGASTTLSASSSTQLSHTYTIVPVMTLRVGQILRGVKGTYQLSQPLKDLTVFNAKVLSSTSGQAKR